MSKQQVPLSSKSEEATLKTRGFRLVKKLGQGSYAKVYLGEFLRSAVDGNVETADDNTGASPHDVFILACKIIDTKKAPTEFVRKFLPRELDIIQKLRHPHIIYTHKIFTRHHKFYIFMRYAENGDMLAFILKHGAIPENQARVWARQIGLGLQYLHALEIAHRDLKCENILVTQNFNVKIADFGFSRFLLDDIMNPVLSKTFCGSLQYAAPEIIKGTPYNPKLSDIWAFGVVLFTMLNKSMPFDDDNAKALYAKQINRRWRYRSKVNDQISFECKIVIKNMLEPVVKERWNVEEVIQSDWIAMDPRMRTMTPDEFSALTRAQDELRALREGTIPLPREKPRHNSIASNITLDIKKSDLSTRLESKVTETSTTRRLTVSTNQLRSRSTTSRAPTPKPSSRSQAPRSQKL